MLPRASKCHRPWERSPQQQGWFTPQHLLRISIHNSGDSPSRHDSGSSSSTWCRSLAVRDACVCVLEQVAQHHTHARIIIPTTWPLLPSARVVTAEWCCCRCCCCMYHTVLCAAHTVDITSKLRAFEATFKAACFKGGVAPNKALLQVLQQHQEDAVPLKRVREGEWGQLRTEGGGHTEWGQCRAVHSENSRAPRQPMSAVHLRCQAAGTSTRTLQCRVIGCASHCYGRGRLQGGVGIWHEPATGPS